MNSTPDGELIGRLERLERENAALAKRVRTHRRVFTAALLAPSSW